MAVQPRTLNCWEFMKCGREPGGRLVADKGVCPAAAESRLDGSLGGVNGGRCCWIVAGTFCGGQPQGTFATRFATCRECDFFKKVEQEESRFLYQAHSLLLYLSSSEAEARDRYHRVLRQVIDPAVIEYAISRDVGRLRTADERHVTAFFSDITGFSELSRELGTANLGRFLNEYLSAMTESLKAEGGTLDKYVGDAIVGIFGAPGRLENDALAAAQAALRMQDRLSQLHREWRARGVFGPQAWSLQMRIGLSSGLANVGFMGTSDLTSYTMSGATVNLAAWLEQACKAYGVQILVSQATRDQIASKMVLRRIDTVQPKGYAVADTIYELLGPIGATPAALMRAAEVYEEALNLKDRGRWDAAAALLRRAARRRESDDRAADRLLRLCERLGSEHCSRRLTGQMGATGVAAQR